MDGGGGRNRKETGVSRKVTAEESGRRAVIAEVRKTIRQRGSAIDHRELLSLIIMEAGKMLLLLLLSIVLFPFMCTQIDRQGIIWKIGSLNELIWNYRSRHLVADLNS